ncbi:MAG: hypothetical protein M1833_002963 [Piccolia ochrophora]|nr:MAG: hypothetical protein M1833_002963 [Piccolia ochrophora]
MRRTTPQAAHRVSAGRRTPGVSPTRNGTSSASATEDEESHSALFPQFCTICDKQITAAHNASVLYCSEKCRKRDASSPADLSFPSMRSAAPSSPPLTPYSTPLMPLFTSTPPPNFIVPASPTAPPSPPSAHYHPHLHYRPSTEHTAAPTTPTTSHAPLASSLPPPSPPQYSTQYTYTLSSSTRPLPPRTNTTASSPRGVELVTPWSYAAAPTRSVPQTPTYSEKTGPDGTGLGLVYEKTWSTPRRDDGGGRTATAGAGVAGGGGAGLKKLFAFREMQGAGP